jgi:hypothetical protein
LRRRVVHDVRNPVRLRLFIAWEIFTIREEHDRWPFDLIDRQNPESLFKCNTVVGAAFNINVKRNPLLFCSSIFSSYNLETV